MPIKELVKAEKLSKVSYSDKPLSKGGKVLTLTPDEFKRKFGITYSESMHGQPSDLSELPSSLPRLEKSMMSERDLPRLADIKFRMQNPLDCLVICNMGAVGYGLFATKKIPEGEVLFLYSGEITQADPNPKNDEYSYIWGVPKQRKAVNARARGGLARFMQHLPVDKEVISKKLESELDKRLGTIAREKGIDIKDFVAELMGNVDDHELDDISFCSVSMRSKLAVSNVRLHQMLVDGVPVIVCWAERDIDKNMMLGFSYGHDYWQERHKKPRYFKKDGSLIPRYEYTHKEEKRQSNLFKSLATTNPVKLYQQAVQMYNAEKHEQAIRLFEFSLDAFLTKKETPDIDCARCYSGIASCFRDMGKFEEAVSSCEAALAAYFKGEYDKATKTITKHHACLAQVANTERMSLYRRAVIYYHNDQYMVAISILTYCSNNYKDLMKPNDLASYHSTLASCYREVGQLSLAINHCEKALEIRQAVLNLDDKLLSNAVTKLESLKDLARSYKEERCSLLT